MQQLTLKNILTLTIGNALEWYDFYIYSFVSIYFVALFFPSHDAINSLLASTATLGVAFLIRPLGGLILGRYSDLYGRIKTLNIIILITTVSLMLVVVTPTYYQIGLYAPLCILVARLLQGFATGAEFGVSAALLTELAPPHRKGFYGSLQTVGQMIAVLLSAFIGMQLATHFSHEQIEHGAWRIPFVMGLLIAPVGLYLRQQMRKTTTPLMHTAPSSLLQTVKEHIRSITIIAGLVSGGTVAMYVTLSYMPIYATKYLHLTPYDSYLSVLIGVGIMTLLIPFFGWLSDHVGRKPLLLFSMLLYLLELYPSFTWLNATPSLFKLMIVQILFCLSLAIYYGAITTAITEILPTHVRATCLSLGFNMGVMLFGAFAQFIVTVLIDVIGSPMAITIYPLCVVCICLLAASCYQMTHFSEQSAS